MSSRLGFYTPGSYPEQESDLLGYALNVLVSELIVGPGMTVPQAPTLAALFKAGTSTDVIRWNYNNTARSVGIAASTASALDGSWPGTDSATYQNGSMLPLELTIGATKMNNLIKVSGNEMALAREQGVEAIRNLFASRLQVGISGIISALNSHLYVGGTSGFTNSPIFGLEHLFETNAYAGLTHTMANYSGATDGVDYHLDWRPKSAEWAQSAGTLTFNDGTDVAATAYDLPLTDNTLIAAIQFFANHLRKIGNTYNFIVGAPDVVFAYSKAYELTTSVQVVNGQLVRAEAGFNSPSFEGFPVIADRNCPADTLYFLDTSKLQFLTKGTSASTGSSPLPYQGLNMAVGPLAVDTVMTQRYELLTLPQLLVTDTTGVSRLQVDATDMFGHVDVV